MNNFLLNLLIIFLFINGLKSAEDNYFYRLNIISKCNIYSFFKNISSINESATELCIAKEFNNYGKLIAENCNKSWPKLINSKFSTEPKINYKFYTNNRISEIIKNDNQNLSKYLDLIKPNSFDEETNKNYNKIIEFSKLFKNKDKINLDDLIEIELKEIKSLDDTYSIIKTDLCVFNKESNSLDFLITKKTSYFKIIWSLTSSNFMLGVYFTSFLVFLIYNNSH